MFNANLKTLMEQKGISQAELSKMTGIGKPSISQWLSGKNVPKEAAIQKIADALGCSVESLKTSKPITDTTDQKNSFCVSIAEAAKRLGKSEQFIRVGIQCGILPFGRAVKLSSRWTYHISPKLLAEYIGE